MSYSLDFRQHVLEFKAKHQLTFEETATHFGISIRSLFRWSNKLEPCTTRNKQPTKISNQKLLDDIKQFPDSFLHERAIRLGVSKSGIGHALTRLKITRKKNTGT